MSDDSFLNDPDLAELEQQLNAVQLSPSARQRERLLFSCGRAAGRAEMRRQVYASTAVAAVCLCLSLGLAFDRIERGRADFAAIKSAPDLTPASIPGGNSMKSSEFTSAAAQRPPEDQLTATMNFERFLALNDLQPRVRRLAPDQTVPAVRVLTAADFVLPDNL
jgi:hypothetical protein